MKLSLYDWCIEQNKGYLLEEWDYSKNIDNPHCVSYASNKYAKWRCSKDFKNRHYYIISAENDNYKHFTGVQTELSGNDFFDVSEMMINHTDDSIKAAIKFF